MADRTVHFSPISGRAVIRLQSWAASSGAPPLTAPPAVVPAGPGGQARLLTLSPYEWLVVSDTVTGPSLHERVAQQAAEQDIAAVDLSCALRALRIEGPAASELLAKGCGLDLHPESFPAGHTTRTRFAQLAVVLDCVDRSPRFELYIGRSYFGWAQAWLEDAAIEFHDSSVAWSSLPEMRAIVPTDINSPPGLRALRLSGGR